ncbi:iron ABC transporter substrate-binding protein [Methanofollis aquaemaris]|uniref:Iron ABC transporter substrate-binding protein n=1 Tax=Methanofollis aquaemaris TaxID=126734 RepID=A0A8A3S819_9EURY|nr:ABC transporter substrate-binding protein [Methanofollis aquaemaris]QSZ68182.1 iron ABC transporter substrate-binding protein [Methanofollis aquaemaris]
MRPTHTLLLVFVALVLAAVCAGCTGGGTKQVDAVSDTPVQSESKIVTDMRGLDVSIPKDPQRVVVMADGMVESVMIIFGVEDRIVGLPRTPKNYVYNYTSVVANESYSYKNGEYVPVVLYPGLRDLTVVGREVPNYETIASLSPDLVLLRSGSCSFPDYQTDENSKKTVETIESLGIPVVLLSAPECSDRPDLENLYREIAILGEIFDREEEAGQIVDLLTEKVALIDERTRDVPDADRPSVLFFGLSSSDRKKGGVGNVRGIDTPDSYFLEEIVHAKNAFRDPGRHTLSVEQVLTLDPDVILLPTSSGYHPPRELYESEPFRCLQELKAVKNRQVYALPWTPSRCGTRLEFPIDLMIAAKGAYPELFSDIRICDWTLEYYSDLYGVDEETAKKIRSAQWLDWTVEENF